MIGRRGRIGGGDLHDRHADGQRRAMPQIRARVAVWAESGSASLIVVSIVAMAALAITTIVPLLMAFAVRARVSAAADAAALAAADTASGLIAGYPCEQARDVATANNVSVLSCTVDGIHAFVTTSTKYLVFDITATSHAGPPP